MLNRHRRAQSQAVGGSAHQDELIAVAALYLEEDRAGFLHQLLCLADVAHAHAIDVRDHVAGPQASPLAGLSGATRATSRPATPEELSTTSAPSKTGSSSIDLVVGLPGGNRRVPGSLAEYGRDGLLPSVPNQSHPHSEPGRKSPIALRESRDPERGGRSRSRSRRRSGCPPALRPSRASPPPPKRQRCR